MENPDLIKQNNCLNTIRLLAALQVMLAHMGEYLALPSWLDPLHHVLSLFPGVPLFFMLSGFLIWNSIEHSNSWKQYMGKRVLRIYPELWLAVLVEILSILLLYRTPVPAAQMTLFAFGQATLFQYWKPEILEGYGCGTPNGSLWTIPVIVGFYIVVWFIHRYLHNRKLRRWTLGLLISFALGILVRSSQNVLGEISYKLLRYSLIPHFWLFYLGMFAAEFFPRILPRLKKGWFWLPLAAVLLRHLHLDAEIGYYPLLDSCLLFLGWLGFAYRYPDLNIRRDISYGLYIYHMIVVNGLIAVWGNKSLWLIPAAVILTLIPALLSTYGMGKLSGYLKTRPAS